MTEKLKQITKEEITKLPKEIQKVINIFDWMKISEEIGKKYLLTYNEINNLQAETLVVLVGLENPDFYASNIENNISTSKSEAEKIAEEVNQKIFMPIYYSLTENIKKSIENKNQNWKQTLDFILSGGDYSVFMERNDNTNNSSENSTIEILDNTSKLGDFKNKFII